MPRIINFEIPVDDPARAMDFYKKVFGWKFDKWEGPQEYGLPTSVENGEPGVDGAAPPQVPDEACLYNTVGVSSFDEYAQKIEQAGGNVITEKMTIPGAGIFAFCADTEGNVFGIIETDPSTK
jgi:predicted enzyme related to lactoylglutathione lyase